MTRMLSRIFGAEEHRLQQGLRRLERVSGFESADVRLTAEVLQASKRKMMELGLDPHDTTGRELYAALKQRLIEDDAKLTAALLSAAETQDGVAAIAHAIQRANIDRTCYALKTSALKSLLRKQVPKQTMKRLGYRSLDSMLKHEPVGALLAAAVQVESLTWRRSLHESYRRLKSSDFETRQITILMPSTDRWHKLTSELTQHRKHTMVALKELGTIVLLPQTADMPTATTTMTLVLSLRSINEIRAASTFLKLSQVKANFGSVVQEVVSDEPVLSADMLDEQVPWQIIQRYYARFPSAFRASVFEPHIHATDISWHTVEQVLSSIEPSLGFWHGSEHLTLLQDDQPVSMNLIDVALAVCNQLPYDRRIVHYLRHSLWHELLLKYLKHENVEEVVINQLNSELALEPALN